MVWRIFSWHTLGPLVPIEHCLNATVYLSIFADHVYPFMTTVYQSSDGYFQQDNAPMNAASTQISNKKRRAPLPPKAAGPAPVRALQLLPQRQGPNPPPSPVGEPKTTDNSSCDVCRVPVKLAATFTNVCRTSGNPVCL